MNQSVNDKVNETLNWFIWAKACECMVYSIGLRWLARDIMWLGGWDASNVPFAIALLVFLLFVGSIAVGLNAVVWILNRWFWREYAIDQFVKLISIQMPEDNESD